MDGGWIFQVFPDLPVYFVSTPHKWSHGTSIWHIWIYTFCN